MEVGELTRIGANNGPSPRDTGLLDIVKTSCESDIGSSANRTAFTPRLRYRQSTTGQRCSSDAKGGSFVCSNTDISSGPPGFRRMSPEECLPFLLLPSQPSTWNRHRSTATYTGRPQVAQLAQLEEGMTITQA